MPSRRMAIPIARTLSRAAIADVLGVVDRTFHPAFAGLSLR